MVTIYGLNEKIGNISFYDSSGQSEYSFNKPYSERTAQTIDEEVKKLIDVAYARTKMILSENKEKLSILAEKLLEREVIFREDLEEIFGKREWDKEDDFPGAAEISRSYQDSANDRKRAEESSITETVVPEVNSAPTALDAEAVSDSEKPPVE